MSVRLIALLLLLAACQANDEEAPAPSETPVPVETPIQSRIIRTEAQDLVLQQTVILDASVQRVWEAYTTEEGWRAWASPAVEIDLRAGGTIRTHYDLGASVGDPGTNTLQILNYVPERLLTLQAEVEERWPDIMREDAANLMNVIVFEPLGANRSRILSYGVGYRDSEAYDELMAFFVPANEELFQVLKDYLEK